MKYSLNQSTAPTAEPVSLEEAKAHLRIVHEDEDTHILNLLKMAREEVETYTNRQLMTATWDLYLDRFPVGRKPILLPKNPVQSITSIVYTDAAGSANQTFSTSNYSTDIYSEPARIILKDTASYPEVDNEPNVIRVRFVAGYATAAAVPWRIKAAMLLLVERMYRPETKASDALSNLLVAASYGDEFAAYGMTEVGTYAG